MSSGYKAVPPHLRRKAVDQTNQERALVLSTSPAPAINSSPPSSISQALTRTEIGASFSPTELIQHDVIRTLRAQLQELNMKCDGLEAENYELKEQVNDLSLQPDGTAAGTKRHDNICGYASSEEEASSKNGTTDSHMTDKRADALAGILGLYDQRMTKYEERIAQLEAGVSSMRGPGAPNATSGGLIWSMNTPQDASVKGRTEKLEQSLAVVQRQDNEHGLQLRSLLQWRDEVKSIDTDKTSATRTILQDYKDSKTKFDRKIRQEDKIDNAITEENLYRYFTELSRLIDSGSKGTFEGDLDELWSLRERVVMRLAVWLPYQEALVEAQKRAIYDGP